MRVASALTVFLLLRWIRLRAEKNKSDASMPIKKRSFELRFLLGIYLFGIPAFLVTGYCIHLLNSSSLPGNTRTYLSFICVMFSTCSVYIILILWGRAEISKGNIPKYISKNEKKRVESKN